MTVSNKKETILLFLGDLLFLHFSLWLMLVIRYGDFPNAQIFFDHLIPFSILFIIWIIIFFIAGLYEKHTLLLKSRVPTIILNTQIVNSVIAVLFFYFVPFFGITPKTNLFIYLVFSFAFLLVWRIYGPRFVGSGLQQKAIIIGNGEEMYQLKQEVNLNPRYNIFFISSIDLDDMESVDFKSEILDRIYSEQVEVIAVDLKNDKVEPILPSLYNLIFSKIKFIDMYKVYEDIFDRIPLSLVKYNWFLENISVSANTMNDLLKRTMDLIASLIIGLISLVVYPFVFVAIKFEDDGPIFFTHNRIGQNNKIIKIYKFRSFEPHNESDGIAKSAKVTKVGEFLRKTRIDELPQIWSVVRGDLSLIGPRPEIPELVKLYEKEIPYYNIRHLIKPGLSGWAQLYHKDPPKFNAELDKTKVKLSFDLYYLKNRSLMLDVKIALKTLKALLSRSGV